MMIYTFKLMTGPSLSYLLEDSRAVLLLVERGECLFQSILNMKTIHTFRFNTNEYELF